MFKLEYTNSKGQSVELFGAPYHLHTVEGLGDVEAINHTQKSPYQDGVSYIDTYLSEKYITIGITLRAPSSEELSVLRSHLAAVFNPKLKGGTLKYTNGSIVREITAIPDGTPFYPDGRDNRTSQMQKVILALLCPDPYWRDNSQDAIQLVTISGGLKFPLSLPTHFGNQDESNKSKIVVNNGDSPSPIEVTFEGPATSPIRVENVTTGKFIEVDQDLLEGEKLIIDTTFGKKRVTKVLSDGTTVGAMNYIKISTDPKLSSTFFQLEPGNNLLSYSTGLPFESAPVIIKFYTRHLAV